MLYVHLHIRGEYAEVSVDHSRRVCSPPHTWRIRVLMSSWDFGSMFTSTYVENTNVLTPNKENTNVHLHIRGEYSKQIPL